MVFAVRSLAPDSCLESPKTFFIFLVRGGRSESLIERYATLQHPRAARVRTGKKATYGRFLFLGARTCSGQSLFLFFLAANQTFATARPPAYTPARPPRTTVANA